MEISFEPVERVTVREEIIKKILELINAGVLKPGSKLPSERELMEQFRVSRTSVREALQSMTMVGLLETFAGAGTFVSKQLADVITDHLEWPQLLDRRDVIELMEVREPLEIQAAGLAAQHINSVQIEQLREIMKAYNENTNDPQKLMKLDLDFHALVAEFSENRTLVKLLQMFNELMRQYIQQHRMGFSTKASGQQEFNDLIMAVADGDEEQARMAMARHLRLSKQMALIEEINRGSDQLVTTEDEGKGDGE
jgi:GntR family transcriptional repressor for pyruvate dehydrogenase complex